jgi:hypothetical protein
MQYPLATPFNLVGGICTTNFWTIAMVYRYFFLGLRPLKNKIRVRDKNESHASKHFFFHFNKGEEIVLLGGLELLIEWKP